MPLALVDLNNPAAISAKAHQRVQGKLVGFDYSRQSVFVNHYYFYLQGEDFGPAFIKVCSYGRKVALLFTKLDARIFRQVFAAIDTSQYEDV